jgi:hypothetical protein
VKIDRLNDKNAKERLSDLEGLLIDAVRNGASVGFVLPLAPGEAEGYWRKGCADVAAVALRRLR